MRKWGLGITLIYSFIVGAFLVPGWLYIAGDNFTLSNWPEIYNEGLVWLWVFVLVGGAASLLLISVDTSQKRLQPRAHVALSITAITLMIALLTFGALVSLTAGAVGDKFFEPPIDVFWDSRLKIIAWVAGLWGFWGLIFRACIKTTPEAKRLRGWLLKGSVLELLIAVPAHVIVRQRQDCSAPVVTSFGIATGIAIALLCFGPSVLLLVSERMNRPAPAHKD